MGAAGDSGDKKPLALRDHLHFRAPDAGAPTVTLSLGQTDASNLPPETISRQAYDAMAAGFGPGSTAPLVVTSQMYTVANCPPG